MMVLIRLSEIFIITGIFRGTLGTITQQIVIFINISSKFFKYTPFRSDKKSYWSISKSRLSLIPPQSVESLRTYARDVFSFTAILEGQFVLRLWMNKPAVNRVCFFTAARRKSSADAVMEPSRARFLLVCSHASPPSLPRWFLPFHRRIFSSCDRQAFYEQIMSFSLTLFETWMSESLEEKTVS